MKFVSDVMSIMIIYTEERSMENNTKYLCKLLQDMSFQNNKMQ